LYLAQFPEGYQRDAALRGIAAAQPPKRAVETALQIANADTRFLALDQIVPAWLRNNPSEAQTWLQQEGTQIPREWTTVWTGRP